MCKDKAKEIQEKIELAVAGNIDALVKWASSYVWSLRRWGISEHTVSRSTENKAIERGVVLVQTLTGYTAIELFSGRPVRSGHRLWVENELKKMKANVVKVITLD
jgi:hypothetical protein